MHKSETEKNFFLEMPSFSDFQDLTRESHYQLVPEDWVVVITDVQGSTKAIESGKYKVVNMAGAATIAAITNAIGTRHFPFAFGGDGAVAVIPPKEIVRVRAALSRSREIAFLDHELKMRIGLVPHAKLIEAKAPVSVAKHELSSGAHLAFFRGEGITLAEQWVKSGEYNLPLDEFKLDFDPHAGLSCRWAPLRPERFSFLSILVKINNNKIKDQDEFLKKVIGEISSILNLESPSSHPVKAQQLGLESYKKAAEIESSFSSSRGGLLGRLKVVGQMLIVKAMKNGILKPKGFNIQVYLKETAINSDYRKYDETLRLVVDASREMKIKLEAYLDSHAQVGDLFYGVHESSTALITCFVTDMKSGEHIHFVDGGDGGYALAAKQMKEQMKEQVSRDGVPDSDIEVSIKTASS